MRRADGRPARLAALGGTVASRVFDLVEPDGASSRCGRPRSSCRRLAAAPSPAATGGPRLARARTARRRPVLSVLPAPGRPRARAGSQHAQSTSVVRLLVVLGVAPGWCAAGRRRADDGRPVARRAGWMTGSSPASPRRSAGVRRSRSAAGPSVRRHHGAVGSTWARSSSPQSSLNGGDPWTSNGAHRPVRR